MADIQIKLIDENSGFIENIKSENNEITILAHYKPSKGYYHEFKITEAEYTKGKPVTLYDENGEKSVLIDASLFERINEFISRNRSFSIASISVEPVMNRFQNFANQVANLFSKNEDSSLAEPIPQYEEGYDEKSNTIIRFAGKKPTKAYQISGIDDVASKNNWKGWLYLAPIIILVSIFSLYPLINTIFISFTQNYKYATGVFDGLTLKNFTYILGLTPSSAGAYEKNFINYALLNTVILVFVTVPVSIVLALLISVALNSIKWLKGFLQTVFFLPYVTNAIAIGMVFSVIFDKNGVINYIFNLDYSWVTGIDANRWRAMIPLCLYIVWNSLPFKILIFLSGLQGIDKQYYQAAQIDSCPKWKVLLKITVPLLSPQILYIMVTSFIGAFKEYSSIVGLFNGPGLVNSGGTSTDPCMETVVYYVYENMHSNTSAAAAAAVFLFVIILAFTFLQFKVSAKKVHY